MINPYWCYVISFSIAILVYQLGWSELYPRLSAATLLFLLFSILFTGLTGWRIFRGNKIIWHRIAFPDPRIALIVTLFLYFLWSLEFLHAGGIPLIKILLSQPYDYRLFGIPSLHVFIVTFSSFFTVLLFHVYLSGCQKQILILYLVNLAASILIYNRGMFLFNVSTSFFVFLFSQKKIPLRLTLTLPIALLILFYFFGMLGTLRVSREARSPYDNAFFLETGAATKDFVNSAVPKEYFWTYIYVSSPLANLQNNINTQPPQSYSTRSFLEMVNNEVLMDFISKRINQATGISRKEENTIPGPFNASTVYSRCFSYLGWLGMSIMLIVVLFMPWLFFRMLPPASPFFHTALATLCTLYLFLAFDNTIRFTGLSFQLVYPLLFHWLVERQPFLRKFFVNNKVTSM